MRPLMCSDGLMMRICSNALRACKRCSSEERVTITVGLSVSVMRWQSKGICSRLSKTMRAGWRKVGKLRTLSFGLSASTVPIPVKTAQLSARRICTSSRAASPVIQKLRPSKRAVLPSKLAAHLRRINGLPRSIRDRKPRLSSRACASSKPLSVRIPAASSMDKPLPATNGLGSVMAATTRATPE